MANHEDDEPGTPLLTIRTTLVFLLAVLTGTGAGLLAYFASHAAAEAVLVGGGATAAAIRFFHWLIR
jgi:hypothetical protein